MPCQVQDNLPCGVEGLVISFHVKLKPFGDEMLVGFEDIFQLEELAAEFWNDAHGALDEVGELLVVLSFWFRIIPALRGFEAVLNAGAVGLAFWCNCPSSPVDE